MKTSALFLGATAILDLPYEVFAQVRLPFSRQPIASKSATQRRSFSIDFFSAEGTYVVNATVGTPPQNLSFALTLSTDESWVPDAQYCDPESTSLRWEGCIYGSYNHNDSSTFILPGTDSFYASYLDGNYAYGDSMREDIGFLGGVGVTNLTMGLAQEANLWMGVMALGFNDSYSQVPNLPDRMLAEGLINSTAYSMWIDEEDALTGNLLFGAVDTAAFDGPLKRISADRKRYSSATSYSYANTFGVYIQAINGSSASASSLAPLIQNTSALPLVTIDPTFSLSVLPEGIATAIWGLAGAAYNEDWDSATIPCDYKNNLTAQISIQLDSVGIDGGPILTVPLSDLILSEDVWVDEDWDWDTETSTKSCLFGVQTANTSSYTYTYSAFEDNWCLGAGMLKRQYMVFDLANEEVAMAPVQFASAQGASDIVPFSTYGAKIPKSSGNISKCYGDEDCSTATSSSGSDYTSSDGSDRLSGDVVGMIAGFSVLGVVMLAIAIWGIVRCCRDNSKYDPNAVVTEKGSCDPEAANTGTDTEVPAQAPQTAGPAASPPRSAE